MRAIYITITFILIFSHNLFSQKGTIKVAKPPAPSSAKKDSTSFPKQRFIILPEAGANYTFKSNNKLGYYLETRCPIIFNRYSYFCFVGIRYSLENENYQLSAFNNKTMQADEGFSKSENKSEYLSLPVGYSLRLYIGPGFGIFSIGLTPEYLLRTKNQYGRLNHSDFNQYNFSGNVSLGIPIKRIFLLKLGYSKDFFDNLKDVNIYNSIGEKIGKQKSKTNLLSLSIVYSVRTTR